MGKREFLFIGQTHFVRFEGEKGLKYGSKKNKRRTTGAHPCFSVDWNGMGDGWWIV
jgi:hypothetical protein